MRLRMLFLGDKPIHPHSRKRLESAIEKFEEEMGRPSVLV